MNELIHLSLGEKCIQPVVALERVRLAPAFIGFYRNKGCFHNDYFRDFVNQLEWAWIPYKLVE
jgi:hypothetical protein